MNGYINHVALVLDASSTMIPHRETVVAVADAEVRHLARRSQELDQETRVSVYAFASEVRCLVFDKDVLRLPSLRDLYHPHGMTALVDATLRSQDDLAQTAQLYGDHAFLTYVLTDGQENYSSASGAQLARRLAALPGNWTVACMVPDQRGAHEAKKFGFPADNIAVWDATSRRGVEEAGGEIRRATESFMTGRAAGVRGTRTLFAGGAAQVNRDTVRASQGFRPLGRGTYALLGVNEDAAIRDFVERETGESYRTGSAFYELVKPEKIQAYKVVMVRNRRSGRVYAGPDSRRLLNLPDTEVRVRPEANPDFQIFVQSTSVNRKLPAGTKLLVLAAL